MKLELKIAIVIALMLFAYAPYYVFVVSAPETPRGLIKEIK